MTDRLPTYCRWVFALLTAASLLSAVVTIVMMFTPPRIEYGPTAWGTLGIELPADTLLLNKDGPVVSITGLRADISDREQHDLVVLMKRYILPLELVASLFGAVLFDLFRRLFRNVERGKSFSPETITLMRGIGFSLLGYSLIAEAVGRILVRAVLAYFRGHPTLLGHGVIWNDYQPATLTLNLTVSGFSFIGSLFFAGILVLVLSEVFRQGLRLKSDNELTI